MLLGIISLLFSGSELNFLEFFFLFSFIDFVCLKLYLCIYLYLSLYLSGGRALILINQERKKVANECISWGKVIHAQFQEVTSVSLF